MFTIVHNLFCSRPNITALGEVLEEIEELNRRLQPHLQRFTQIVRDDAESGETVSVLMCVGELEGMLEVNDDNFAVIFLNLQVLNP